MTNINLTTNQDEQINVQVVYALPKTQKVLELKVRAGTTIKQAIEKSGILQMFPDINLDTASVGVYARLKTLDYILQNDDRIEIYRELLVTKKVEKTSALKVDM